ncbi:MAG: cysteine desulfurase DndA [Firmicutes bacterium]|nr:cysteine desulfurase DndA [Bacillota bacterium]
MSIYLDYNASAPVDLRVVDEMFRVYRNYIGNADSRTHDYGERAGKIVDDARGKVAFLLGVNKDEVFFTSGATESNNIAIQGLEEYGLNNGKKHIVTTAIEHKAVLETVKVMEKKGFDIDIVSPDESGRINVAQLLSKVRSDTLLVSVMHVNNESGIIQPVFEIGNALAERNILFHIDATQSCGKLVDEIRKLKYDMLSFSAHKLQGPQGIGVLVLKKKRYKLPPVKPIMYGGQQERGIRPGTIPVALVAGLGRACEIAEFEYQAYTEKTSKIKNEILDLLESSGLKYTINGNQNFCISSTLNFSIEGVSSEALMLSTKQYCGISNGSACTSQIYSPSYVLAAMGLSQNQIESSIRVSWGGETDLEELKVEFKKFLDVAKAMC